MSRFSRAGLYLHVPFCTRKCPYCDFYSLPATEDKMDLYCAQMKKELLAWGENKRYQADTLYFGGGTPSLLGAKRLAGLVSAAKQSFSLSPDSEITLEMNPCSAGGFDFVRLREAGFNRLSLGMQSASPEELGFLSRSHTPQEVYETVQAARKAGFDNISLDLMLGLQGQTPRSVEQSAAFCREAGASHVSAYLLKVEPGTRFYVQREKLGLPGEEETAELYLAGCSALEAEGFLQYEISNFSLPGKESRHNLKYWNGDGYLGLGPSAHSFWQGKRFYTPASLTEFLKKPVYLPEDPQEEELADGSPEEYVMLRLRLRKGLSEKDYWEKFQSEIPKSYRKNARRLAPSGLVQEDCEGIRLTRRGFLVSNYLIGEILWHS